MTGGCKSLITTTTALRQFWNDKCPNDHKRPIPRKCSQTSLCKGRALNEGIESENCTWLPCDGRDSGRFTAKPPRYRRMEAYGNSTCSDWLRRSGINQRDYLRGWRGQRQRQKLNSASVQSNEEHLDHSRQHAPYSVSRRWCWSD